MEDIWNVMEGIGIFILVLLLIALIKELQKR